MSIHGLNLIIPEKSDEERDRVADAWVAAGGTVTRLDRFWEPPALDRASVRIYGNDTFALVLAQKLELHLLSPPDDLLVHLPPAWLQRRVQIRALCESPTFTYPIFVKPVVPKLFRAAIYANDTALASECKGWEPETKVFVSEIVSFAAEARSFLLHGEIQDISLYEGDAPLDRALSLLRQVARCELLPGVCVIDLGFAPERGWAVIEANAAWGAGLNGCSAEKVIPCIAAATRSER